MTGLAGFRGAPYWGDQDLKFEPIWGSIGHFLAPQEPFLKIWRIRFLRGSLIFSQMRRNFILTAPMNADWVRSIRSTPHTGYLRYLKMAEIPGAKNIRWALFWPKIFFCVSRHFMPFWVDFKKKNIFHFLALVTSWTPKVTSWTKFFFLRFSPFYDILGWFLEEKYFSFFWPLWPVEHPKWRVDQKFFFAFLAISWHSELFPMKKYFFIFQAIVTSWTPKVTSWPKIFFCIFRHFMTF